MAAAKRGWRIALWVGLVLALLPVVLLVALNMFINLWLPLLINVQPERVRITWAVAWTLIPGQVEVRRLKIRSQSPFDQLLVTVDHATGTIDLRELLHQRFRAYDLVAEGATFRYRARDDAPRPTPVATVVDPGAPRLPDSLVSDVPPPPPPVAAHARPPIEGLVNPPDPNPEAIYPPPPGYWTIILAQVALSDVREIWVEDYHFVGNARLSAEEFTLQPTLFVSLIGTRVEIVDGQVLLGDEPALLDLHGVISVALDDLRPKEHPGRTVVGFFTVDAKLAATVKNLAFLKFYLQSAPWLELSGGEGALDVAVKMNQGAFAVGSLLTANVQDISARFLSYSIVGDGRVQVGVFDVGAAAESRLDVNFDNFSIDHAGDAAPHATGKGLSVTARTADVALDAPFTALRLSLDLPESIIPDARVYNTYLPKGVGLSLREGKGTVSGHLDVTTPENIARGQLKVAAQDVRFGLDDLTVAGDLELDVLVPSGKLDAGRYDISGSKLALRSVRVTGSGPLQRDSDDSRGWWATLRVPRGTVDSGAAVFLDTSLAVKMRDSVPFVTIFSEKQPLPPWLRGILAIDDLSGTARLRLGEDRLHLTKLQLKGDRRFALALALKKEKLAYRGKLYVEYGVLRAGLLLDGDTRKLVVLRPREWFDAEAAGG